jgi:hypothetical protein
VFRDNFYDLPCGQCFCTPINASEHLLDAFALGVARHNQLADYFG